MPYRTPPLSRARLIRLGEEWQHSIGFFCLILTWLYGLIFLLDPLVRSVPATSPYARFGEAGVVVFGVIFFALASWEALIARHEGYVASVILFCGVGLVTSVKPLSLIGFTFYSVVLVTVFAPRIHAALRDRRRHDAGNH